MSKNVLEMDFKDAAEKKVTLRLDDPKADLTSESVNLAMNNLLGYGVLANGDVDLVLAVGARTLVTTTTDYEIL
ncbi:MAG: DUF2922 domain-containing protein [Tissierellia bacterium]|nr:DUF2922 domain-containing protein [Tissierellia bacterium]